MIDADALVRFIVCETVTVVLAMLNDPLALTVRIDAHRDVLAVMLPVMIRTEKPLLLLSNATVLPDPFIVTVDVPAVNVVLAPEVSQLPETVHDPVVNVIVPLPLAVTFATVTVLAFAVNMPDTERFAPPEIVKFAVASVPETVSVLLTSISVDIVYEPETVRL